MGCACAHVHSSTRNTPSTLFNYYFLLLLLMLAMYAVLYYDYSGRLISTLTSTRAQLHVVFGGHCVNTSGKQGRVCSNPRCNSFVTKYGLCKRHGGRDKCTMAGCNTNAEARGLCRKHGATGFCSSPGCSSYVHARHMCRKHSDTGVCSVKECKNFAQVQGLCRKHSGQATCATSGCNSLSGLSSLSEASAMCRKHVSPRTNETCTAAGCTHSVQARSLCKTHLLTGDALLDAASTLQAVDSIPMMLSAAAAADEVLRLD